MHVIVTKIRQMLWAESGFSPDLDLVRIEKATVAHNALKRRPQYIRLGGTVYG